MNQNKIFIALDVGEKRIGVATGDSVIRIAIPKTTLEVDGTEIEKIKKVFVEEEADAIIIGYPRNQSGQSTAQSIFVEEFAEKIKGITTNLIFQDESLTSVMAEERLKSYGKPYSKADIDKQAATIILQDYLDRINR